MSQQSADVLTPPHSAQDQPSIPLSPPHAPQEHTDDVWTRSGWTFGSMEFDEIAATAYTLDEGDWIHPAITAITEASLPPPPVSAERDTPMPDRLAAHYENTNPVEPVLRRVDSDGNTVVSIDSDDEQTAVPPPPPPPPPAPHDVSDEDDDEDDDDDDDEDEPHSVEGDRNRWEPLYEDESRPNEAELRIISSMKEHSALESVYWKAKTFDNKDLDDTVFQTVDEGSLDWRIEKFNGSKASPNVDLVMHSPSIKLAGLNWRLKLYPKGNETSFMAVYLECEDLLSSSCPSSGPLANGVQSEYLETPLPVYPKPVKKGQRIPVQFGIIIYNPDEPRTHWFKRAEYSFSSAASDRGFNRFGPDYWYRLGSRMPDQRQPLIRHDKLALTVHIRILSNPTGCLFEKVDTPAWHNFVLVGSNALDSYDPVGAIVNSASIIATVSLLMTLPNLRRIWLGVSDEGLASGPMPLVKSLLKIMLDVRRELEDGRDRISIKPFKDALRYHRVHLTDVMDPMRILKIVRYIANKELSQHTSSLELLNRYWPDGVHYKLPAKATTNAEDAVTSSESITTQPTHDGVTAPAMFIVELRRHPFNHATRQWDNPTDRVAVPDTIKKSGIDYKLVALVNQDGASRYCHYSADVRPDGVNFFRYSNAVYNRVIRLTRNQAINSKTESSWYLAFYVEHSLTRTESQPELTWQPPEWLLGRQRAGPSTHDATNAGDPEKQPQNDSSGQDVEMRENGDWDAEADDEKEDSPPDGPVDPGTWSGLLNFSETEALEMDYFGDEYHRGTLSNEGFFHGPGYHIYHNGDEYTGDFQRGERHGHGKQTFFNGDRYEGEWADDRPHGQGVIAYAKSGNVYTGTFKDGRQDAPGVTTWNRPAESSRKCQVCYENDLDCAFWDCGHVVACYTCGERIDKCPMCMRSVNRALKLYFITD